MAKAWIAEARLFFLISRLEVEPTEWQWLRGVVASLPAGLDPADREALKPRFWPAALRAHLRRGAQFNEAAAQVATLHEDPDAARERALELAKGLRFWGDRRRVFAEEILIAEANDLVAGRSRAAVVQPPWVVPEAKSARGVYLDEPGTWKRLLGVVATHRDVEGACRICGKSLGADLKWRNHAVQASTSRIRFCGDCDDGAFPRDAKNIEQALQALFDELRAAAAPPGPARVEQRITVEWRQGPPAASRAWPREKREQWLRGELDEPAFTLAPPAPHD